MYKTYHNRCPPVVRVICAIVNFFVHPFADDQYTAPLQAAGQFFFP